MIFLKKSRLIPIECLHQEKNLYENQKKKKNNDDDDDYTEVARSRLRDMQGTGSVKGREVGNSLDVCETRVFHTREVWLL